MSLLVAIPPVNPINILRGRIIEGTDGRMWAGRLVRTFHTMARTTGPIAATAAATGTLAANIYALAASSFLAEGSYRSIEEVVEAYLHSPEAPPPYYARPVGDEGGWATLVCFTLLALGQLSTRMIRQAESTDIQKLFKAWHTEMTAAGHSLDKEECYQILNDLLTDLSSQSLIQKRVTTRLIMAHEIFEGLKVNEQTDDILPPDSTLRVDRELIAIYRDIQLELDRELSTRNVGTRFKEGLKVTKMTRGNLGLLTAVVTGVVVPIFLLLGAISSYIGLVYLIMQVFRDRDDLVSVGHIGEWLINAIESIAGAYYLLKWIIIAEGDLVMTKQVFEAALNTGGLTPNQRERLTEVANQQLQELASQLYTQKLSLEYKFRSRW